MNDRDTRNRKLKDAWKRRERDALIASIPLAHEVLRDLFDYLDRENPPPCDHTLRETVEFLTTRGIDPHRVVPWLQSHGGYCDCEVIYNVEEKFGEIVGRSSDGE